MEQIHKKKKYRRSQIYRNINFKIYAKQLKKLIQKQENI